MKICTNCKLQKEYSCYSKNRARSDGYHNLCKVCRASMRSYCPVKAKEIREKTKTQEKKTVERKQCCKCKVIKSSSEFNKDIGRVDGLVHECKACRSKYRKLRHFANRDLLLRKNKEWRDNNKARLYAKKKAAREQNIEEARLKRRTWEHTNRWRVASYAARKRAKRKQAVPKWLTKEMKLEIKEFYKNCQTGYQVDHIVPISGKEVCGLHVPWNLQYLTAEENLKKLNKF